MARAKKTIRVDEVKKMINDMIKFDLSHEEKSTLGLVLEEILHRTNNYKGFRYLNDGRWQDNVGNMDREYF